jgi:hypothetical protein
MIAQTSENKTGGGAYEVDRPFFNCGKLRMALVAVATATMRSRQIAWRAQFLTSPRPPERFQRADTVTNTEGAKSLKKTRGEDAGFRSFPERRQHPPAAAAKKAENEKSLARARR